jgi:hypothetical protein
VSLTRMRAASEVAPYALESLPGSNESGLYFGALLRMP